MLAFAVVLVITADVVVDATFNDTVSSAVWTYGAGFALIYAVAHVAVRWLAPYADPLILPAVALLNGLGLVLIRRLDLAEAADAQQDGQPVPAGDAEVQVVWTCIGSGAVRRRAADRARPPGAGPVRVHAGRGRPRVPRPAGDPAGPVQRGERREDLDPAGRLLHPAGRVRQARADGLLRRVPGAETGRAVAGQPPVRWASTCPAAATSARCWWPGAPRCSSWSARRTSAPRCCSSASSSC